MTDQGNKAIDAKTIDAVKDVVAAWLDDNELDYVVSEVNVDVVMLRPNVSADTIPMLLFKTAAGWTPWVYADVDEEGWTELYDLDEVV